MTFVPRTSSTNLMTEPPILLTMADVCGLTKLGGRTVSRMISTGAFPKADIAIGGKIRRWKRQTILRWIEEQCGEVE